MEKPKTNDCTSGRYTPIRETEEAIAPMVILITTRNAFSSLSMTLPLYFTPRLDKDVIVKGFALQKCLSIFVKAGIMPMAASEKTILSTAWIMPTGCLWGIM
jgi:hypothetical protein